MLRKSNPIFGKLLGASAILSLAATPALQAQFKLQILHASDLEGGVEAIEDAPNFAAVVQGLENAAAVGGYPSIFLSAGDNYLPGPFLGAAGDFSVRDDLQAVYQTLFAQPGLNNIREAGGRVDVAIMNILGIDASAVGNHEFDLGTTFFADTIATDIRGATFGDVRWLGANFPYLSANLDFSGDGDLSGLFTDSILPNTDFQINLADLTATANAPKIAQATTIQAGGQTIGVVGATTPIVETISSTGEVTVTGPDENDMEDLADEIQPVIDALIANGVNKIILVTHLQQIALEKELAGLLEGVDVIIAGGSDTLQADGNDTLRPGDTAAETYPFQTTNADGDPTLIVSTDGEYSYVGRLVVDFDANGVVLPGNLNNAVNGAYAAIDSTVANLWPSFASAFVAGTKGNLVEILTEAVLDVVIAKDSSIYGASEVFLEGRRAFIRSEETNMGNLTADANLWYLQQTVDSNVVVSIKNAGGIRAEIGEIDGFTGELLPTQANPLSGKLAGEISQLDVENTLRFDNGLTLLDVTLAELISIIEYGISAWAEGATPGQFPQVGGVSFSFDPTLDAGERLVSLSLKDLDGNTTLVVMEDGVAVANLNASIRIVTLGFLADGGDGYTFPSTNRVDTGIGEQEALEEYLGSVFPISAPFTQMELPISQDQRIQNLWYRSDTAAFPPATPMGAPQLAPIGVYETGSFDESAAEITAFDPGSDRLFLVNAEDGSVDILDLANPAAPQFISRLDINDLFGSGDVVAEPNSVDIHDGLVAVAVARIDEGNNDRPMTGLVAFFDTSGNFLTSGEAGYLPDMIVFSPDGRTVLTANEGEPAPEYDFDPQGSVSVFNVNFIKNRMRLLERFPQLEGRLRWPSVRGRHATFAHFERPFFQRRFDLSDLRIFGPGSTLAQDMEPEYISVSEDSRYAYVSLQENNALAVIDVRSARVVSINPFGFKDWSQSELDVSNQDDAINIMPWPIYGMYQPDAIASWSTGKGRNAVTYVITANEGDARDYDGFSEEERVKDLDLDPTAFPNADWLQENENLGRINVTTTLGDPDGDGDYDALYAYGARSFSIWKLDWRNNMTLLYDSGSLLEKITASLEPEFFNSSNDESGFDNRSDDKGPEPEGLDIGVLNGRTYVFLGMERVGGIMVFDITTPATPEFVQYINVRDFLADPESSAGGDLGPEGILYIPAADSPSGVPLVVVANEVSGSVRVYTFQ